MTKLTSWDDLHDISDKWLEPEEYSDEELDAGVVASVKEAPKKKVEVVLVKKEELVRSVPVALVLSEEHENIALAMLETFGDVGRASRLDYVSFNAMALRHELKRCPDIRIRYQELLSEKLVESGLHISERILKMVKLQDEAMGCSVPDGEGGMIDIPADAGTVIALSREISKLISEGKQQNMSSKSAIVLASKEDAKELLEEFLRS